MLLSRFGQRCCYKLCAAKKICERHISQSVVRRNKSNEVEFHNPQLQTYLERLRQEYYDLRVNAAGAEKYSRLHQLNGIVSALEQYRAVKGNITSNVDIEKEKDAEMQQLYKEENYVYSEILTKTEESLMALLYKLSDTDYYPSLNLEINAGAGGQEAMLFAKDMLGMYTNFFNNRGWEHDILNNTENTDLGGLRYVNIFINSREAFTHLRNEAGVHRVQRIPTTEKHGRMHTSTVSVTVIPRPPDVFVKIAEKDLKIETKRASGAGGQHVNTTDSAVRIVHLPTGIAVESQSERSQIKNREIAYKRLYDRLVQEKVKAAAAEEQATRKAQQGNLDRNEKIRTYNFVQDRVTDHRIRDGTVHNLQEFLNGGAQFQELIQRLVLNHNQLKLSELIATSAIAEKMQPPVHKESPLKQA